MQAIRTCYHGPTNVSGSRMSARCDAGKIVIAFDHALDIADNHAAAARALQRKLGWTVKNDHAPMYGGCFEYDYYWVFTHPSCAVNPINEAQEIAA